jgi:hypothetical protein
MKVQFVLSVNQNDYTRDGDVLEVVILTKSLEMSFIPHEGMNVIIGNNVNEISNHEVKKVTWHEISDSLNIMLEDYDTGIDDGETIDFGWKYFDGLIREFIESDGWEILSVRGVRNPHDHTFKGDLTNDS